MKNIPKLINIPIVFLTAQDDDTTELESYNLGAVDYIKKPYTLSVLLAKVKAVLKRMNLREHYVDDKDAGIWLDEATMKVGIKERVVQLKAKEFKLFACLFEHRGTIVTKDTLFATVWGDTFYSDGTLNVHIRRLREKLEKNPDSPELIKTVWGTGYLLEI